MKQRPEVGETMPLAIEPVDRRRAAELAGEADTQGDTIDVIDWLKRDIARIEPRRRGPR